MATRLDAVQLAVPRAVTDAQQQQHAAQRQPVVAQEHVATQVKQNARAREQRPEAPQGAGGGRVRDELLPEVEARRDPRDRKGGRRGLAGQPRSERPAAAAPAPDASAGDGRGSRVDIRL